MKFYRTIWVLQIALILSSCLDKPTENVKDAADKIKDATKNLQAGMVEVGKIDPLALNKLLSENKELREQLTDILKRAMPSFSGEGVVNIRQRKVLLSISNYNGSFRVKCYINKKENILWDVRINDKNIPSPFADMPNVIRNSYNGGCTSNSYAVWMPCIGNAAKDFADRQFSLFLKNSILIPGPNLRPLELNSRFGGDGIQNIFIEVTPIAYDQNRRWAITAHLYLDPANGTPVENIMQIDLDNDIPQYKDHPMNVILPNRDTQKQPTISVPLIIKSNS